MLAVVVQLPAWRTAWQLRVVHIIVHVQIKEYRVKMIKGMMIILSRIKEMDHKFDITSKERERFDLWSEKKLFICDCLLDNKVEKESTGKVSDCINVNISFC